MTLRNKRCRPNWTSCAARPRMTRCLCRG